LNVLSDIGITLDGSPSPLLDHVRCDYGSFEVESLPATKLNIAVEFVNETSSPRNCVQVRGPVSYDDRGVLLHDSRYRVFRIDFDSARARTWRATCDVDFEPHLFDCILEHMIHFQLLKRGKTFCHAAAFRSAGKVALCAGWRGAGKTNLLLHAWQDKATYIADDWAVVHGGGTVQGLPKRLNLLYQNFEPFPDLLAALPRESAALVDFVGHARTGEFELNERVAEVLEGRARVQIPPAQLFGQAVDSSPGPIDRVYLLQHSRAAGGPVKFEAIDLDALVTSLAAILEFEQSDFLLAYSLFRARTGRRVELFDLARSGGEAVLTSAFADLPAVHRVSIPASCDSREIYAAVATHLSGSDRPSGSDGKPKTDPSSAAA
jgi:hypothetical protein